MAAVVIPLIGTEFGPCKSCEHRDCQEMRTMAAKRCPLCEETLGYGRSYYVENGQFYHAFCLEAHYAEEAYLAEQKRLN